MKRIITLILLYVVTNSLVAQNIMYTIIAEKDNQRTPMDSVLFENLSNGSSLLFEDFPVQDSYVINLSSQHLENFVGINDLILDETFQIVKSMPGEISFLCTKKDIGTMHLSVYSLLGQVLFSKTIDEAGDNNIITVFIPNSGMNIISIDTRYGKKSFRILGGDNSGTIGYTSTNRQSITLNDSYKSAAIENVNDFSFNLGDSIRISGYSGGYSAPPVDLKITGSETLTFNFSENTSDTSKVENLDHFIGSWFNEDIDPRGFTRLEIRRDGENIFLHAWGKCSPTDCDWGESKTDLSDLGDNILQFYWNQGFAERNQVVEYLGNARLMVTTFSHYIDDSGRSDRERTEYFFRF